MTVNAIEELTPMESAAWGLIYNMIEAGAEPEAGAWWEQEFLSVKRLVENLGLNTDPEKALCVDQESIG
jgi:hypothetical protein